MPPAVTMEMPKWMLWKRHAWSIKTTSDHAMWLKCIGIKALVDNGATDATSSQVELLATRVLSIVRAQLFEEVKKGLAALFHPSFDTDDLADETRDFWQAVKIFLHRHRFKLAKRLALLIEAAEYFSEEARGTLCSALGASPRGREVLDEAKVHLKDCRQSSDQLQRWDSALERCTKALDDSLNEAKDQFSDRGVDHLAVCIPDLMTTYIETNEVVLEEFTLKPFDDPVQAIVSKFLNAFLNSFIASLTPLMKNDLDLTALRAWYEDDLVECSRTILKIVAQKTVTKTHALWSTDVVSIIARQVRSAESILFFFEKAAQLPPCALPRLGSDGVVSEADSHRMVRVLKDDFTLAFVNIDFRTAVAQVLLAPLLQRNGDLLPRLEDVAVAESTRVAKQILEKMSVLVSVRTPVQVLPVLDVTQPKKFEDFQAVQYPICFRCMWNG